MNTLSIKHCLDEISQQRQRLLGWLNAVNVGVATFIDPILIFICGLPFILPFFCFVLFLFYFRDGVSLLLPRLECNAMARSRLTATSASWVQAILLPQPPE